ncbi:MULTISPECIES: glycosyltransferase family 2 protein [Chitinophagaceae]|uniref:glycosyltransferase family 2 protein n=1 Tax=Chitinophagaceae TaxID=563835 RepID=UPI000DEEC0E2|nr:MULTISPECIES: glycosyltransferase family A protein [Chitinophagaceae]RPD46732.1 glycosyltransferase family 2 protein [Paracnuella aquatica]
MELTPLVSVIITFLNEERFLAQSVESVLAQTYKNWELILVDDGSTDSSVALAKQYAAQHPGKIFYYEHPGHSNQGLSASRNAGIAASRGSLVAFLDADDIWLPEKMVQQVGLHLKYPDAGLIAEGSVHWYNWNERQKENCIVPVGVPGNQLYPPQALTVLLYPLKNAATPGPCSWMLTRAAIDRVGGFESSFRGNLQLYEDQAFLCKVYLNEYVYIANTCNNWYRQRDGSIMKSVKDDGKYDVVRQHFLGWMKAYLQQKGIHNTEIDKLVDKALFPYQHPQLHFIMYQLPKKVWNGVKRVTPVRVKDALQKLTGGA